MTTSPSTSSKRSSRPATQARNCSGLIIWTAEGCTIMNNILTRRQHGTGLVLTISDARRLSLRLRHRDTYAFADMPARRPHPPPAQMLRQLQPLILGVGADSLAAQRVGPPQD